MLMLQCVVGTGRFELPTCRLGGDRSIHLSYVPIIGNRKGMSEEAGLKPRAS
jgi:hypothetical protein